MTTYNEQDFKNLFYAIAKGGIPEVCRVGEEELLKKLDLTTLKIYLEKLENLEDPEDETREFETGEHFKDWLTGFMPELISIAGLSAISENDLISYIQDLHEYYYIPITKAMVINSFESTYYKLFHALVGIDEQAFKCINTQVFLDIAYYYSETVKLHLDLSHIVHECKRLGIDYYDEFCMFSEETKDFIEKFEENYKVINVEFDN